ncbi:uncharacterized protein LOC120359337 [Solenopsis invicta]|uniref:uncharacterized protein LOC120359337 n=1 Tax=Solenopsis invicta TaxID=13686 RepID=UPI00193CCBE5|nr:uncharacterized protein LOC120359337 [Solenopsis invicta]
MEKLQFEFAVTASSKDEKTNIIAITSISTEEGKRYVLPAEFRHIGYHKELMKTENYNKLKNTLKTRHQKRKVWIKMTEDLKKIYIDEDQNLQFENQYLEEIDEDKSEDKTQKDNLTKILEKLVESSQRKEEKKNLKQISEKFMIEKFTSKHSNTKQWLETFEKECTRFDIIEDETKIEILRLFLDKSCSDWHSATLTKLTVQAGWDEWKDRFLETFADKGWSTVKLLRKNEKFIWAEDCERSFTEIKKLLCSQPVLEIFDKDLLTRIYTDASLEGIGAIFKQVQHNGIEKPVAYFSKKLNESQKRKKAIYLECLAIKEAVKYWQHWLIGRRFEVYSDHKPLESMNIKARTDEELGDLMYYLSQYDFQIKYVPGKDNAEADCLSRNPVLEPTRNLTENIKKICKTCEVCIKNKSRGQEKYGRMSQLGPATRPFEIMSMDTIGGFGGLRSTKKYLHLLVDHFTRYAFIATSKTQNATDFIKLVKNVVETDKIETILTDQYPGINSREFKEYLEENDVRLIFTAYLLDGTDTSILPEELRREKHQEDWMKDKELALERTIKSHDYNKKLFDKNRKHHEFNTGDMVYIENGNRLNRKKLDDLRIGPLEIIEKISNSIYRIKTNRKKSGTSLFHITKLIPISDIDKDADEED